MRKKTVLVKIFLIIFWIAHLLALLAGTIIEWIAFAGFGNYIYSFLFWLLIYILAMQRLVFCSDEFRKSQTLELSFLTFYAASVLIFPIFYVRSINSMEFILFVCGIIFIILQMIYVFLVFKQ